MTNLKSFPKPYGECQRIILSFLLTAFLLLGCGEDESGPSGPESDTTPPSVPENLEGIKIEKGFVSLTWFPSIDNVGIAEYWIRRDGSSIGNTPTNSYIDSLAPLWVPVEYIAYAVDSSGNESDYSEPFQITVELDVADVVGDWSGILTVTSPFNYYGGSVHFDIAPDGTVSGTADTIGFFSINTQNPGAYCQGQIEHTSISGQWSGQDLTLQVTPAHFGQNDLTGGTINLIFERWNLATGTYNITGTIDNPANCASDAFASGTVSCEHQD